MNPDQNDFYFQNMMMQQNPNNYIPSNQAMMRNSPISNITSKMNFQTILQGTTKTVSTINQVVPLIYQVTPLINNARNAFRVIKAVNVLSAIDLDEIDREVIIDKETQTPQSTMESSIDKFEQQTNQQEDLSDQNTLEIFENML